MANLMNTWSKQDDDRDESSTRDASPKNLKTKLSKQSREFRLGKTKLDSQTSLGDKIYAKSQKTVHISKKKTMDSDFSTQGSDSEPEITSMKASSQPFFLREKSGPASNQGSPTCKTGNSSYLLDRLELETRDDLSKNSTNDSDDEGFKSLEDPHPRDLEALSHRPKRRINHRRDKKKYTESYRAKKKTEICKNWENTGRCKFGNSCAFAHGHEELLVKNNLPDKYKTKMCKQFHEEGYCRYGKRCQFVHCIIQKDIKKFNFSDILKESLFQFESRSKSKNFPVLEDQMINALKGRRLPIFEEIAPNADKTSGNSDKEVPRVWETSVNFNNGTLA